MKFGSMRNQAVLKASAGSAMNVIELIAVPAIEKPTAQPGIARPPTKYPSVVRLRRRTNQAIQAMPAKYTAITAQSATGIEVTRELGWG
jgi:hypothetical protein